MRTRLDRLMVDRGLAESREKAQALIMAGEVLVDGRKAAKAGQAAEADCVIEVLARPPFVGRGGLKLAAALRHFGIDASGKVCVDIGASTGGFTDALLQAGASRVYAVDVGSGQLAWSLRTDPRVVLKEGINARELTPEDIGEAVDLIVCDVSFISVTLILPAVVRLLRHPPPAPGGGGVPGGDGGGVAGGDSVGAPAPCGGGVPGGDGEGTPAPGGGGVPGGDGGGVAGGDGVGVPAPCGQIVILIKPQFEVGKGQVGKGGIVREPELHRAACEKVTLAVRQLGFETAIMDSPITGAEGNKEFLLYAHH